jgi:hypothetical protein
MAATFTRPMGIFAPCYRRCSVLWSSFLRAHGRQS